MFWGLIMEPGKKYSQKVQKSFHISHAALDLDSAQNQPVQVLLSFENRNYLLCTLNKDNFVQTALDLNFQVGDKVSFATNGPGHVHLTGYLIPEDDLEEIDLDEGEEEEAPELSPVNDKKRKAESNKEKQHKKLKSETEKLLEEIDENDTDESDDEDVNLTDLLEDEASEEEDDEEAEDEEDDDEEVEEEEEVVKEKTPTKKQKKEKRQKQQTPQQNGIVKEKAPKQPKEEKSPKSKKPEKKTLQGGLIIEDLKIGEGATAIKGSQVQVYYEGRLQSNNKMFDSTNKGSGFRFRLGKQEVIKGWDIGIIGMKVGGKRRIICPPNMAYGAQGSPPMIPPQSTLVFDVEMKKIKN